ncbi:MAG: dienelactone hydrolase family protein [Gemmatimonadaceae bacterium]
MTRPTQLLALPLLTLTACVSAPAPVVDEHAGHAPGATEASTQLTSSPRHGEWVTVSTGPGDSVRAWVVYPERRTKAPVVIVVHEIFGLSPWIRSVADQLAADGFLAVAPDLLTTKNIAGSPENPDPQAARAAISTLSMDDVHRQISAVARYAMALPAGAQRYGIVGFCWGGAVSFEHAVRSPSLGASVVYYGTSPAPARLTSVRAPVLGLYGSDDARVNATVPPADSAMKVLGKTYRPVFYEGAGHGFLRQQDAREGKNLAAAGSAVAETSSRFHPPTRSFILSRPRYPFPAPSPPPPARFFPSRASC